MEKNLFQLLFQKIWLDINLENLLQQDNFHGHTPADKKAAAEKASSSNWSG